MQGGGQVEGGSHQLSEEPSHLIWRQLMAQRSERPMLGPNTLEQKLGSLGSHRPSQPGDRGLGSLCNIEFQLGVWGSLTPADESSTCKAATSF